MRHEFHGCAPIRRATISFLTALALLTATAAEAQFYVSGGAVLAKVPYRFDSKYTGGTADIAFGGGRHFDFLAGFTALSQQSGEDPIHFRMLEIGAQYRTAGKSVEGVFGATFGWASRGEYDNDGFSMVPGAHARLVVWPFKEAGLFTELRARELDGSTGTSLGLTLGLTLRTRP